MNNVCHVRTMGNVCHSVMNGFKFLSSSTKYATMHPNVLTACTEVVHHNTLSLLEVCQLGLFGAHFLISKLPVSFKQCLLDWIL